MVILWDEAAEGRKDTHMKAFLFLPGFGTKTVNGTCFPDSWEVDNLNSQVLRSPVSPWK